MIFGGATGSERMRLHSIHVQLAGEDASSAAANVYRSGRGQGQPQEDRAVPFCQIRAARLYLDTLRSQTRNNYGMSSAREPCKKDWISSRSILPSPFSSIAEKILPTAPSTSFSDNDPSPSVSNSPNINRMPAARII